MMNKWMRLLLSLLSTVIAFIFSVLLLTARSFQGVRHVQAGDYWSVVRLFGFFSGILMAGGWLLAIPLVILLSPFWIVRRWPFALASGTALGPVVIFLVVIYMERHSQFQVLVNELRASMLHVLLASCAACLTSSIYIFFVRRHLRRAGTFSEAKYVA